MWFPIRLLYSNYCAILYRLRDIATYWSKIAKFLLFYTPPVFSAPAGGDRCWNIANMFDTHKTRMIGVPCDEDTMTIC